MGSALCRRPLKFRRLFFGGGKRNEPYQIPAVDPSCSSGGAALTNFLAGIQVVLLVVWLLGRS